MVLHASLAGVPGGVRFPPMPAARHELGNPELTWLELCCGSLSVDLSRDMFRESCRPFIIVIILC